jgi:hypothetical protein
MRAARQCEMAERPEVAFDDALCDEELVQLRWEQRRRLRLLSAEFVRFVDGELKSPQTWEARTFDPRIAEVEVRHAAADLETPLLVRIWGVATAVRMQSVNNMFEERGTRTSALDGLRQYASDRQEPETLDGLRTEASDEIDRLRTFVAMLLIADELAGDYRDPRLGT